VTSISEENIVKDYKVEIIKKNGKHYIKLLLKTDTREDTYLLEWGPFTRNLAIDLTSANSEVSIKRVFSL